MLEYEISSKTCALLAINSKETEVIEEENRFIIDHRATKIIKKSCEYYGCTLEGRLKGSQKQLGMKYKLPIVIENTNELIFFPTTSPRLEDCSWISLNNIKTYQKQGYGTLVEFNNGITIELEISLETLENQINRATRLMLVTRQRSKMLK
ncbi:MAG: hypothetical protein HFH45_01665 [Bacilli bacterium]|nr:hypothetical protein [Bacilli bacterium]